MPKSSKSSHQVPDKMGNAPLHLAAKGGFNEFAAALGVFEPLFQTCFNQVFLNGWFELKEKKSWLWPPNGPTARNSDLCPTAQPLDKVKLLLPRRAALDGKNKNGRWPQGSKCRLVALRSGMRLNGFGNVQGSKHCQ